MATQTLPTPGYETVILTRAEASDEAVKQLQDRLIAALPSFQGELVMNEDWGRKKLAYPIEKETKARYSYLVYTGRGEVVAEIERNLRLSDHVLRYLTVKIDSEFDAAAFNKRREDIQATIKRRAEEREARREERASSHRERGDRYSDRGDRGDRYSESRGE